MQYKSYIQSYSKLCIYSNYSNMFAVFLLLLNFEDHFFLVRNMNYGKILSYQIISQLRSINLSNLFPLIH